MTDEDGAHGADTGTAVKPADAAVRQALVDGHRRILAFLRRRLGSTEDGEEVLQDFMLRAIERSDDLRDIESVRGWLARLLATTIADHQRRAARRRRQAATAASVIEPASSIEPDLEIDKAVCDCLYALLPTLRPDYAEVIRRVDLLGEPRDQVAASLCVTVNNLAVRLHRARQALRKRLLEMCLTCPVHGFRSCGCKAAERARRRLQTAPGTSGL
jgi:RNA polymerase sigma factor (sigma-70 family)